MPMQPPSSSEPLARTAARGAAAGTVATLAMSAVMLALDKLEVHAEQPPEAIVEQALDAADVRRSERTENVLASIAHLAFGAGAGKLYALMRRRFPTPGPEVGHGIGWGLGVYAASYAGWVPALGILPRPDRDRTERQVTMVLAHVVYGAVLGAIVGRRSGAR